MVHPTMMGNGIFWEQCFKVPNILELCPGKGLFTYDVSQKWAGPYSPLPTMISELHPCCGHCD